MDYEGRLKISYFEKIKDINLSHGISLVKHIETGEFFVRKNLSVYSKNVYDFLLNNPIPSIPKINSIYEENNTLTVIEEYVEGTDLNSIIESKSELTREQIIRYILLLSKILKSLHSLKTPVIHRDIKPSNIIIDKDDNVWLIDFNAGKFYDKTDSKDADTTLLGTHGFAAPEQYGFGESTPRTDIYGVGVLIKTLINKLSAKIYSEDLLNIASKCTEINPNDRYQNIDEVIKELRLAEKKKLPDTTKLAYKFNTSRVGRFLKKYTLPGFRNGKISHAIIALPVYIITTFIILRMKVEDVNPFMTPLYRIIFGLMALSTVFCTCNYLDIHRYFPLCKNKNILLKALGVILLNCAMYTLFFIILVITVQFM